MTESSDINQPSSTDKDANKVRKRFSFAMKGPRVVSPGTLWKYCCLITIVFWGILIVVMLYCGYFPPPEKGTSTITSLIEALKFFTYTLTGVTFGYPFVAYFLKEG